MDLQLKDKTALVTGASMGIGRAIAKGLAAEGARIAIAARRRNLLEELEKEIGSKLGIIECDFLKNDAVEKVSSAALAGLGSVGILASASSPTRCCRR